MPSPVVPAGRQVVQSAQLQLSAAPDRISDVAQQVFNVVGAEKGFVNSSNVTSGAGNANAGADFQLSVPSANLAATLTDLSRLHGAHVVSRTDQTNDITAQVGGAGERLAEARALRRSLLKQLAAAATTAQVDSVQARLHDANASIASDLSTLRGLQRQVAYSRIALNIQPAGAPAPVAHHRRVRIGSAAHDAGRVLVVVAGVGLIVLAVLCPSAWWRRSSRGWASPSVAGGASRRSTWSELAAPGRSVSVCYPSHNGDDERGDDRPPAQRPVVRHAERRGPGGGGRGDRAAALRRR